MFLALILKLTKLNRQPREKTKKFNHSSFKKTFFEYSKYCSSSSSLKTISLIYIYERPVWISAHDVCSGVRRQTSRSSFDFYGSDGDAVRSVYQVAVVVVRFCLADLEKYFHHRRCVFAAVGRSNPALCFFPYKNHLSIFPRKMSVIDDDFNWQFSFRDVMWLWRSVVVIRFAPSSCFVNITIIKITWSRVVEGAPPRCFHSSPDKWGLHSSHRRSDWGRGRHPVVSPWWAISWGVHASKVNIRWSKQCVRKILWIC